MESFYGDNNFILERQRGLRSFQIHIHIEVPAELTVTVKLYSVGDCNGKSDSSEEFSNSFEVQYFPPIVLTCLLPKSYPSHPRPYFTISVQWLDSSSISHLCSMLDSIWMEKIGLEVIYQWADWPQNYSLSYLGIEKDIILGPYGTKHNEDRHAISGIVSLEVDVPSLRSYNDEQCHENFCFGGLKFIFDLHQSLFTKIFDFAYSSAVLNYLLNCCMLLEKVENFEPPESTFAYLIEVYGRTNKTHEAIELFHRIPKFTCVPSVYSLNTDFSSL
ncbi:hypothetical protein DKX38_022488 [Salix brachista]|uniref:RWD domain-containing protein n=1 Tax=Salix brachista TaxID=2182728 RepID=A0A5N5JZR0_9ROSI|nr:hypothetical protein DKX38_022488 [Salix brachista]